jgi:hypothetical protein
MMKISVIFAPSSGITSWDLSLVGSVYLIALFSGIRKLYYTQNNEGETFRVLGISLVDEIVSPGFEVIEALLICDIVDQNAAISASVECTTYEHIILNEKSIPKLWNFS